MKKLILLGIVFLIIPIVYSETWTTVFTDCPTTFNAQDCQTNKYLCGVDTGDNIYCNLDAEISAPTVNATTYSTNNDGSLVGGYSIDCESYDSGDPFCDVEGAYNCERNETCYGSPVYRNTVCIGTDDGGGFGVSACGTCQTGSRWDCYGNTNCESTSTSDCDSSNNNHYITATCNTGLEGGAGGTCECDSGKFACDGDIEDGDGCEIVTGASCGAGATWASGECVGATGNCTCTGVNFDCNNDDADDNNATGQSGDHCEVTLNSANATHQEYTTCENSVCESGWNDCNTDLSDGCEIEDNSACSIGSLSGTYNVCTCEVDPVDIATSGSQLNWSGTLPFLWLYQMGVGPVVNFTVSNNASFIINDSGPYWNGTALSLEPDATGGAGGGASNTHIVNTTWNNVTYYTDRLNSTINASIDLRVNLDFLQKLLDTIYLAVGILVDIEYVNTTMFQNYSIIRTHNTSWFNDSILWENSTGETKLKSQQNITIINWFKGLFNWTTADDWNQFDGSTLTFNESKLSTTYYNATQASVIAGTIDDGILANTQHSDGSFDSITFNFSEASGSPGLDMRINFTNISAFNRGIMRYKTNNLKGDFPIVQMWSYPDSEWEDYPAVSESETFATMTQPVFDDSDHIGTEGANKSIAKMRIYKASIGNTQNEYYVDWIAISKGYGTPSGEEIDPEFNAWLNNPVLENDLNVSNYDIVANEVRIVKLNATGNVSCLGIFCFVNVSGSCAGFPKGTTCMNGSNAQYIQIT